jgi:predicted nucleic acid-binding protein
MRELFADASVFITLAEIGREEQLLRLDGEVIVPRAVADEIRAEPAAAALDSAADAGELRITDGDEAHATGESNERLERAAVHLGYGSVDDGWSGDVALLAFGLGDENAVVVTDDGPLRKACKALGVTVSGSIGVLVAAVEHGNLEPDDAKDALVAMDETEARLSASLVKRAEALIDDAAGE